MQLVSMVLIEGAQRNHIQQSITRVLVDAAPDRRVQLQAVLKLRRVRGISKAAKGAMHLVKVHDLALCQALQTEACRSHERGGLGECRTTSTSGPD